jgi:hypothetical protein
MRACMLRGHPWPAPFSPLVLAHPLGRCKLTAHTAAGAPLLASPPGCAGEHSSLHASVLASYKLHCIKMPSLLTSFMPKLQLDCPQVWARAHFELFLLPDLPEAFTPVL